MNVEEQDERAAWLLLMGEVAYLAVAVNEMTPYCVFFEYSGHVRHVRVVIAESKQSYGNEVLSTDFYSAYADLPWKMTTMDFLRAKRDHLLHILEEGEPDYANTDVVRETYERHNF